MQKTITALQLAPLGKKTEYIAHYQKDLLFPILRQKNRDGLGIKALPFSGHDIWTAFELSWLNAKGKPVVAYAELSIPCDTPNLIESKSLKLYFNSFNNTVFDSFASVEATMQRDLSEAFGGTFTLKLLPLNQITDPIFPHLKGISLDELDIACDTYTLTPDFLTIENDSHLTEILHSDLLKSNCLVTGQPDWGSIQIEYTGKKISHAGLLKYIVSFRNTNEFAETCVERIFIDIMKHCQPEKLLVHARFTRRGGLDINPYRANYPVEMANMRLWRQ